MTHSRADGRLQPVQPVEDDFDLQRRELEKEYMLETGSVPRTKGAHAIHCLTVIGQIEGHSLAPQSQKTTKYEHVIPQLVSIEEDPEIEGLLVILNTVGGDVEAGLALAELIAGVTKPSATLGHSNWASTPDTLMPLPPRTQSSPVLRLMAPASSGRSRRTT